MPSVCNWSNLHLVWYLCLVLNSSDAWEIAIQHLFFCFNLKIVNVGLHVWFVVDLTNSYLRLGAASTP